MLVVFCTIACSRLPLGEPEARIGLPFLSTMFGATYTDARSPGDGMTRLKCAPEATIVTPAAKRPLLHGNDMHEWRMVATLPARSTAVT